MTLNTDEKELLIMDKLFIQPYQLKILTDIFSSYCPDAEIWAYGSRVNGDAHLGCDLDLVVKSFNSDSCNLIGLRQLIHDSQIPFLVDLNVFDKLPDSFQKEILKKYLVIWG